MQKRGQAWGFDLMIAATIFLIGIVLFYFYSLNYPSEAKDTLESLFYEGNLIADSLLTEGFPVDWDVTNVQRIGLLSNGQINDTKLDRLYLLVSTSDGYDLTKALFNIKQEYYFNMSIPMSISGEIVEIIGFKDEENQNLLKITRLTTYQDKLVTLDVYIWN
jgi:hypothetical protein